MPNAYSHLPRDRARKALLAPPLFAFALGVYLLALLPRLLVVIALGDAPLNLDEIEYDRIAWNLSEGLGYTWFFELPTTYRSPGYPGLLALVYSVFGPDYSVGRLIGALIAASAAPLTAILGTQTLGQPAGRLASILVALYPPLIFYANALMSENLFGVLLLLTLVLCVSMLHSASLWRAAAAGVVFAGATLTTSAFAAFLIFLLAFTAFRAHQHPGLWLRSAVFTLAALLVLAPWVARNHALTDRIMFLDSRLGINLHIGFSPEADGQFHNPDLLLTEYQQAKARLLMPSESYVDFMHWLMRDRYAYLGRERIVTPIPNEIRAQRPVVDLILNDMGREKALEYMAEQPLRSVSLSLAKFSGFWGLEQRVYVFAYSNNMFGEIPRVLLVPILVLLLAPFALLALLFVLHLCATRRLTSAQMLLLLPIAYFSSIHSVIFGGARFHFVIIPVLALFAAQCWFDRGAVRATLWSATRKPGDGLLSRRLICGLLCSGLLGIWVWGQIQVAERWSLVLGPGGHQSFLPF